MIASSGFVSHPKIDHLVAIVIEHFSSAGTSQSNVDTDKTRVMIFSQYRESGTLSFSMAILIFAVEEIVLSLKAHEPLVRVMSFVGQSSGKRTKGLTQKEQLKVISDFASGIPFSVLKLSREFQCSCGDFHRGGGP